MAYSMNALIKSTAARIQFNIDLANQEIERGDMAECKRFMNNAKMMADDIAYAIEHKDKSALMDNRDW